VSEGRDEEEETSETRRVAFVVCEVRDEEDASELRRIGCARTSGISY